MPKRTTAPAARNAPPVPAVRNASTPAVRNASTPTLRNDSAPAVRNGSVVPAVRRALPVTAVRNLAHVAAAWNAAYVAVHVWWALAGAPRFSSFGESFVPGRWTPVVIGALAVAACLLLARACATWGAVVLGWLSGGAMVLYSFMLALDIVGLLFGNAPDWPGILVRTAGCAHAGLSCRDCSRANPSPDHAS